MISIDDFHKIEIKIGHILSAEKIPDTDKLLKLSVDMGPKPAQAGSPDHLSSENAQDDQGQRDIRQIVSGIAAYFPDPSALVGKKCAFVANLEPRVIKGHESRGMIMGVNDGASFSLLEVTAGIPAGTLVK